MSSAANCASGRWRRSLLRRRSPPNRRSQPSHRSLRQIRRRPAIPMLIRICARNRTSADAAAASERLAVKSRLVRIACANSGRLSHAGGAYVPAVVPRHGGWRRTHPRLLSLLSGKKLTPTRAFTWDRLSVRMTLIASQNFWPLASHTATAHSHCERRSEFECFEILMLVGSFERSPPGGS